MDQQEMNRRFLDRMGRGFKPVARQRGWDLEAPGGERFGFVRFNVRGEDAGSYRVYVYHPDPAGSGLDPRGVFYNESPSNPSRGWTAVVDSGDEDLVEYVIGVLRARLLGPRG